MPRRILFPFEGDTVIGGSHVSALKLAAALDRSKYVPHILVHYEAGPAAEYARSLGLDVEILHDPSLMSPGGLSYPRDCGPGRYLTSSAWRLASVLKRIDADIVHTNEGRMHANWVLPARLAGRKHIWHHRQDPTAFGINKLAPLFSDHIISVSHFSKPSNPVRSVDNKFTVIRSPFDFNPYPPDRSEARAAVIAEMGLPGDALLLGYFGNFVARKRPDHFVRVIAAVQNAMPDTPVHGLLFGSAAERDEPLRQTCLRIAEEAGISEHIHMMGFRQPIDGYMAAMDANLVTALDEPFGRTLIEAMYLGTPVIATRHGGNIEAITDWETGVLVDPDDPQAFVEPVRKLHQDRALFEKISQASKNYARANFGLDIHVHGVCEIYDRLLA
ncbi:glycosyltransferase [Ruegeria arenilitoris]|uniref:glycosyltransferase n=1 Tax=Ruegeria arenilitoris TaxID=1173585 RepID=UPI00147B9AF0|nr:glycosyltransferase [Ruegeria arenilitoris]